MQTLLNIFPQRFAFCLRGGQHEVVGGPFPVAGAQKSLCFFEVDASQGIAGGRQNFLNLLTNGRFQLIHGQGL
ncbi:MAG: hypothetical protein SCI25_12100 [Desulfuromonadales bacterium]|nr:hypothetical protein [Desulfuromonadales bacterium]